MIVKVNVNPEIYHLRDIFFTFSLSDIVVATVISQPSKHALVGPMWDQMHQTLTNVMGGEACTLGPTQRSVTVYPLW